MVETTDSVLLDDGTDIESRRFHDPTKPMTRDTTVAMRYLFPDLPQRFPPSPCSPIKTSPSIKQVLELP
jgi:hypothetical protein